MNRRQFSVCGNFTHLRLLTKQFGCEQTNQHMAMLHEILPIGETSIAALKIGRKRRRLVVKATRTEDGMFVEKVHWQRWQHIPATFTREVKDWPLLIRIAITEFIRAILRSFFKDWPF